MSTIRVEINGRTFVVEGASEAELERGLRVVNRVLSEASVSEGSPHRPVERPRGRGRPRVRDAASEARSRFEGKRDKAVAFLRLVQEAGSDGITSEDAWEALQLKSSKALGSTTGSANELIVAAGFSRDSVYRKDKSPGEPAVFYAGPKIDEALEAILQLETPME